MSLLGSDIDDSNLPPENFDQDDQDDQDDLPPVASNISSKRPSMANIEDSQVESELLPPQPEAN